MQLFNAAGQAWPYRLRETVRRAGLNKPYRRCRALTCLFHLFGVLVTNLLFVWLPLKRAGVADGSPIVIAILRPSDSSLIFGPWRTGAAIEAINCSAFGDKRMPIHRTMTDCEITEAPLILKEC